MSGEIADHLIMMLLRHKLVEAFQFCPTERRHQGRPATRWKDFITSEVWEHLPRRSQRCITEKRDVWVFLYIKCMEGLISPSFCACSDLIKCCYHIKSILRMMCKNQMYQHVSAKNNC